MRMDFDVFLSSLESAFDELRRQEADALVTELADAERMSVNLAQRLVANEGARISLVLRGGVRIDGVLVDAGTTWCVVREGVGDSLIPLSAVVAASPLSNASPETERITRTVGIGRILRELQERGYTVVIDHDAGQHKGRVRGVYADHFDIDAPAVSGMDSRDRRLSAVVSLVTAGIVRIRFLGGRY